MMLYLFHRKKETDRQDAHEVAVRDKRRPEGGGKVKEQWEKNVRMAGDKGRRMRRKKNTKDTLKGWRKGSENTI
ncbi:hypothetical protein KZC42_22330 [Salmonella enterica subsp. enterica serovar Javiana]|uniref:hypothetical protein n=1 Tax=Salmonella enterica TaxID=28901 RepID=UPI001C5CBED5|nr:hypothetical protein [Salmonella enterica]MBW3224904.1 hypothetical protein [Salmonella enterica subsp. enterica serovar Javiana]